MNYDQARPLIQSGDLLAFSHYTLRDLYDLQIQIVRCATQSEYSHVGIAYVMGGRVWLIESVVPKVRMIPLSNVLQDGPFYWTPLGTPLSDAELEFYCSEMGVGDYSKLEAVQAQLGRLDIGANHDWECAELVISGRRRSGLDLGPKAVPTDVVRAAQRRPGASTTLVEA